MPQLDRVVVPLKFLLVLAFAGAVLAQVMMVPGTLADMADNHPEKAHLRWPLLVVWEFWLLCGQVVIVSTWKLLTMVECDRIFREEAFTWVNAIVAAIAAAWVVLLGVSAYYGIHATDPGLPLFLTIVLVVGAVLGLLMVVMRALLRQATELRTDLDGVV
jgi:peptidoglycan/LPS O-acetylase OafA/YrhL